MAKGKSLGKTTSGMQPNMAAMLCYLFGFVTGLIFYLTEKENKFVRFHAMQSIIVFGFLCVLQVMLSFIPIFGWGLLPLISLASLVVWIVLMIKAYQGEKIKLPIAGDMAEKNT